MTNKKEQYLGKDPNGYEYFLGSDLYVYQFMGEDCRGWFCSWTAWERTMSGVVK